MECTVLGRTGLKASVAGFGTGGHSRAGIGAHGESHAADLVKTAYENGVNFFDSSKAYGTEPALGLGLGGIPRGSYILSTKFPYTNGDSLRNAADFEKSLDESLRALRTDYIDIYHIHGLLNKDYDEAVERYMPALLKAKESGKIRFIGVTERFASDTSHEMLKKALAGGYFDVVMVGYNLLNPSAAKAVLPMAVEKGVGALCMFALRSALSDPAQLRKALDKIARSGVETTLKEGEDLSFLKEAGVAGSITEAAYRFCRHARGIGVTLTGTGDKGHLMGNLRAINLPPLPEEAMRRLGGMFGNVDFINGEPI